MLTEWEKTRSQVLRYMKRAGALKGRVEPLPQLELEEDDQDELDEVIDLVRAKYR